MLPAIYVRRITFVACRSCFVACRSCFVACRSRFVACRTAVCYHVLKFIRMNFTIWKKNSKKDKFLPSPLYLNLEVTHSFLEEASYLNFNGGYVSELHFRDFIRSFFAGPTYHFRVFPILYVAFSRGLRIKLRFRNLIRSTSEITTYHFRVFPILYVAHLKSLRIISAFSRSYT